MHLSAAWPPHESGGYQTSFQMEPWQAEDLDLWEASSAGALSRGLGWSAHLPSHLAVAGLKSSHKAEAVGALGEGAAYLAASRSLP